MSFHCADCCAVCASIGCVRCQFDLSQSGSIDRSEFPALYEDLKAKNLTHHSLEKALENIDAR